MIIEDVSKEKLCLHKLVFYDPKKRACYISKNFYIFKMKHILSPKMVEADIRKAPKRKNAEIPPVASIGGWLKIKWNSSRSLQLYVQQK